MTDYLRAARAPQMGLPNSADKDSIRFVSLGMVVLDELHLANGKVLENVIGGSGLYSTLGARICANPEEASQVGCLILAGHDFPEEILDTLRDWGMTLLVVKDSTRFSTRGLLRYEGAQFQKRYFEYTTPTLQPTPSTIASTNVAISSAYHFLASPDLMSTMVVELKSLHHQKEDECQPLIAWEPAPFSCTPGQYSKHVQTAKVVDVYSPNHKEFVSVFGGNSSRLHGSDTDLDRATIERLAQELLESGVGSEGQGIVLVRCAAFGCMAVSRSYSCRWFPAFFDGGSRQVADATGAGNAFLGAFAASLGKGDDITEAAIVGSVAASFAIEQVGLPIRSVVDGTELWNQEHFSQRMEKYRVMMQSWSYISDR